jgi:hypothetical protein
MAHSVSFPAVRLPPRAQETRRYLDSGWSDVDAAMALQRIGGLVEVDSWLMADAML